MKHRRSTHQSIAIIAALLVSGNAGTAVARQVGSFPEAQAAAAELNRPILVEIGPEWCGGCRRFKHAVKHEAPVQAAIADYVLVFVDPEEAEGAEIAKTYHATIFPTFLLANAAGELIDHWYGYVDQAEWIDTLRSAGRYPQTLSEKEATFASAPTAALAEILARDAFLSGKPNAALDYYRAAQRLDPPRAYRYTYPIFFTMQDAMTLFALEDIRAAADAVLANPHRKPMEVILVAKTMRAVADHHQDPGIMLPYLDRAISETAGSEDELVREARANLVAARAAAENATGAPGAGSRK